MQMGLVSYRVSRLETRDTMSIEIQTGVKRVNLSRGRSKSPLRVAMESMAVDDSFLIGDTGEQYVRNVASKIGIKVSISADAVGNRRCWRVS